MDLCRWLASRLNPLCDLEGSIISGPGELHPSTPSCHVQNCHLCLISLSNSKCLPSVFLSDDLDSLKVEMSGLLKELHCPYEEVVSGILKGGVQSTKDHLKFVCM